MKAFSLVIIILVIFVFIEALNFRTANSQANPEAEVPLFSHSSGFYSGSIQVSLSVSAPSAIIRYTLNSAEPTEASPIYTNPIDIHSTTVVRARAYQAGYQPSKIISHTFILNQTFGIPALSVITDSSNLWGEKGIHTHYDSSGDNWERPATIEFFESDGLLEFSSDVGIRLHGGTGRALKKKSFRYYFRSDYGQSRLHYQLLKPKEIDEFKRFVTSASFQDAPGNSTYNSGTLLRDAALHEIGRRIEKDISLGTRPVALFLVGKPWGIYNAIERIDKHFVEINFGIADCDVIENFSEAREGTIDRWNEMIAFFEFSDLSLPQNYEKARAYIDIKNFTRYHIVEIYGGNMDWPDFNNIAFCGRNTGDKWKWLLWDLDNAFAYIGANTFELATDSSTRGTIILRKLLENKEYKNYFLNECADFFNTVLLPESVITIIDSLAATIRNDLAFETNRWGGTIEEWESSVRFLKYFADHRLGQLWQYLLWEFAIENKHLLTLLPPEGGKGKVRINNIQISQYPWNGYYFEDIPIELAPIPNKGFKFKTWSDPSWQEEKVTLILKNDYAVYPIFESDNQKEILAVINEINYNSATGFDPEDWVELYNPSDQTINLSSWHLKDGDDRHDYKFPDGTVIEPYGFLMLCRNRAAFQNLFPDVVNVIGDFGFGLSGNGDAVRIYNASYTLIDSVTFDDKYPWPIEADGNGATLELIDPKSDNTLPQNWRASTGHGSPGKRNLVIPQLTSFVAKDSSGSTKFSNRREVLIEMTEADYDGQIIKWLINENSNPPDPTDFVMVNKPTSYQIQGSEGIVTIYGWVLDNDHQVSELTDRSHTKITLDLTNPELSLQIVAPDQLLLNYSEPVVGANNHKNYRILPSLDSLMVIKQSENKYRLISAKQQTPGIAYQLTIRDVADSAGNALKTSRLAFTGHDILIQQLKLKFITGSQCDFGHGWEKAIDGDVEGLDGTVRAIGEPCFAIFSFADENLHTIHKFRLKTDSAIGSAEYWVREFQIEISATDLNRPDFVPVLKAEKIGGACEEFAITPVCARYIKFNVIQPDSGWRQLAEFEAWGPDSSVISAVSLPIPNPADSYFDDRFPDRAPIRCSNYPNPFNEQTNIVVKLSSPAHIRIAVYNIIGEEIAMLVNDWKMPGLYETSWNGRNRSGFNVPSGIYLLRITSDKFYQTRKIILMK